MTNNKRENMTNIERYEHWTTCKPDYAKELYPKEERIVYEILKDLRDRRGLKHTWEEIDDDVQNEILASWIQIVHKQLTGEKHD